MAEAQTPYRVCDYCGGVDTHPRHRFGGEAPGAHPVIEGVRDKLLANIKTLAEAGKITFDEALGLGVAFDDTTGTDLHIDCCAERGCPKKGTPDDCALRAKIANGRTGPAMVRAAAKVREDNRDFYELVEG